MKAVLFTAYRYLFLKKNAQAINILSIITIVAMACGAGALVIILSTFNGFENLSKNLNQSFQSDLTVLPAKNNFFNVSSQEMNALRTSNAIEVVSQTLEEKAYLKYNDNETIATLKGVDNHYFQTNQIKDFLLVGDTMLENENYTFCMAGVNIANKLAINPDVTMEPISVYFPKSETMGMKSLRDNFELGYLYLNGVFSIFQDYDDSYVLCPLDFIRFLQNSDGDVVSTLEIKIKNGQESKARRWIENILSDRVVIKNKLELDASFYKISRIEKIIVFMIMSFVLVILSFNFIGSLTMHTIEKNNDIKVLNALGFTHDNIFYLYLCIGVIQGLIGGVVGVLVGLFIVGIQYFFGIVKLPGSGTFVIDSYPVLVQWSDIVLILIILFFISVLASFWPASRAKKIVNSAI